MGELARRGARQARGAADREQGLAGPMTPAHLPVGGEPAGAAAGARGDLGGTAAGGGRGAEPCRGGARGHREVGQQARAGLAAEGQADPTLCPSEPSRAPRAGLGKLGQGPREGAAPAAGMVAAEAARPRAQAQAQARGLPEPGQVGGMAIAAAVLCTAELGSWGRRSSDDARGRGDDGRR